MKLKECGACHLVKYCGVKCQKLHRPKHKRACKKRAAELHDEILFRQPHASHFGDCPICCLPLPIVVNTSTMMAVSCCMTIVCKACYYTNLKRDWEKNGIEKCPFCRTEGPMSPAECDKRAKDRADKNDPFAIYEQGLTLAKKGYYEPAFKYFSKAADLGYVAAHNELSTVYRLGLGQQKDEKKELFHREQAAIGGHPVARYNLGAIELENGQLDRAINDCSETWIRSCVGSSQEIEPNRANAERGL